jgi:hypothetical protein
MNYFRRLVARSRTAQPQLQARRAAAFAERDVRIEELDEDVLVPVREHQRASPLAIPVLERALAGATPDRAAPAPPASGVEKPVAQEDRSARRGPGDAPRQIPAEAQRARRVRRVSRVVERTRVPGPPRGEEPPGAKDDAPLVAAANEAPSLREVLRPPHGEPSIVREPPRVAERFVPESSSTTVVNVAIGRIEVRAAPSPAARPVRSEPFRPQVTLEAHLARGSGSR